MGLEGECSLVEELALLEGLQATQMRLQEIHYLLALKS
jgi:hypothetical protein